jgi:septal ring factor EnvC (AmiA/AmiB activator)
MPLLLIPCLLVVVLISLPRPGGPAHPPAPPALLPPPPDQPAQWGAHVQLERVRNELDGQRKLLNVVEQTIEGLNNDPRDVAEKIARLRQEKDRATRAIATLERELARLEKEN